LLNTVCELELDGVLTGRRLTLPSGVPNTYVSATANLFDLALPAGTEARWKIVSGPDPEDAHYQIGLVMEIVSTGLEPVVLHSGVPVHPTGGIIETDAGLAVEMLLPGSNVSYKAGRLRIYDTGDAGWRPLTCVNGMLGVGDIED
jgi:hypothetical protein